MRLWIALKAFVKAFYEPEQALQFIKGSVMMPEKEDPSHLRLLSMLQQSGRIIDFLKEDISAFSDAQVGAAVRKIHYDCAKTLEELVTIRPIVEDLEGSSVTVADGYNPAEMKVLGQVKTDPPIKGKVVHRGWKACKRSLPKRSGALSSEVLCPAEIEVT